MNGRCLLAFTAAAAAAAATASTTEPLSFSFVASHRLRAHRYYWRQPVQDRFDEMKAQTKRMRQRNRSGSRRGGNCNWVLFRSSELREHLLWALAGVCGRATDAAVDGGLSEKMGFFSTTDCFWVNNVDTNVIVPKYHCTVSKRYCDYLQQAASGK